MKDGATIRIVDLNTNQQWDVEAIHGRRKHRTDFGESLSKFCDGSIPEIESRIAEKTHRNIRVVKNPSDV